MTTDYGAMITTILMSRRGPLTKQQITQMCMERSLSRQAPEPHEIDMALAELEKSGLYNNDPVQGWSVRR